MALIVSTLGIFMEISNGILCSLIACFAAIVKKVVISNPRSDISSYSCAFITVSIRIVILVVAIKSIPSSFILSIICFVNTLFVHRTFAFRYFKFNSLLIPTMLTFYHILLPKHKMQHSTQYILRPAYRICFLITPMLLMKKSKKW